MSERDLKAQFAQQAMSECRHFNGIQHDTCKAGVNYRQLIGGDDLGWALKIPCMPHLKMKHAKEPKVPCEKYCVMTKEEAEHFAEDAINTHAKAFLSRVATQAHAEEMGFKEGNGGQSSIPCPACETGTLRYSVASLNGHMHAKCSTINCVSWVE